MMICLALPLLATVSSIPLLIAALFLFGAGLGTVDSTVNLQAVIVERASGKTMMSGFHGLFSLGGIVGAAGVSGLLGLGPVAAARDAGSDRDHGGGAAQGRAALAALRQ